MSAPSRWVGSAASDHHPGQRTGGQPLLPGKLAGQADADKAGGTSGRLTTAKKAELAELRRKNKQLTLEMSSSNARLLISRVRASPKIAYSLARELADDDVPLAMACRALRISRSGYHDRLGRPTSAGEQANAELVKVSAKSTSTSILQRC